MLFTDKKNKILTDAEKQTLRIAIRQTLFYR